MAWIATTEGSSRRRPETTPAFHALGERGFRTPRRGDNKRQTGDEETVERRFPWRAGIITVDAPASSFNRFRKGAVESVASRRRPGSPARRGAGGFPWARPERPGSDPSSGTSPAPRVPMIPPGCDPAEGLSVIRSGLPPPDHLAEGAGSLLYSLRSAAGSAAPGAPGLPGAARVRTAGGGSGEAVIGPRAGHRRISGNCARLGIPGATDLSRVRARVPSTALRNRFSGGSRYPTQVAGPQRGLDKVIGAEPEGIRIPAQTGCGPGPERLTS